MKLITFLSALLLFSTLNAQLIGSDKPAVYIGQTFNAASASADAVNVNRYDTVKFIGCTFNGLLRGSGGSNIVAIGNIFNGIKPAGDEQWNRAVDVYMPQALYVDNCTFNNHTGGIRVDHGNENTRSIVIKRSRFYNIDARNGNRTAAAPWGAFNGSQKAGIILDGVRGIKGEIAYNYFLNLPDSSCIEDNINLRNSGGLAGQPFRIHHNYIDGAYSWPLSYTSIPSVSGITVETGDESAFDRVAQYVQVDSNRIVRVNNGGINFTSGHDVNSFGNTVINSGRFPHNGLPTLAVWGGLATWNGSNLSTDVFKNVSQKNNTVAVVRPGVNNGGKDRQDWVATAGSPINIAAGDNYSLPYTPTKATEDSQLIAWVADTLRASGVSVSIPIVSTIVTTDSTIKLNSTVTGNIRPLNANGGTATAKDNTVVYKSSNPLICTVTKDSTNQLAFTVKGLKLGRVLLTVAYTNAADDTVTATYPVNVVLSELPGVGLEMHLNQ